MSKHTPGPWRISAIRDGSLDICVGDGLSPLAEVFGEDDSTVDWPLSVNARLIAAAPELLVALREMVELWDANHSDDLCACEAPSEDCTIPPRCELCGARAAIAKAEGES